MGIHKSKEPTIDWTHKKLVRRMSDWLKNTKRMTVVMTELTTRNSETPDVIAWKGGASSTLIEVKVSRSDFLADKKKRFRIFEEQGMGDRRYMATPPGLIKPEELPEGWGLLEAHEYHGMSGRTFIREIVQPLIKESNKQNECVMLMSAIRRVEISTAVFVRTEEK